MNNVKRAKDCITESLLYLMKKEKFENITITDISKKAGINRITFYRNFNTKEEVLKCYLDDITDNFIKTSKILYTPDNFQNAFVSGGLYNLYYYWIKNNFKETPQELANIFNNFYISKGDSN